MHTSQSPEALIWSSYSASRIFYVASNRHRTNLAIDLIPSNLDSFSVFHAVLEDFYPKVLFLYELSQQRRLRFLSSGWQFCLVGRHFVQVDHEVWTFWKIYFWRVPYPGNKIADTRSFCASYMFCMNSWTSWVWTVSFPTFQALATSNFWKFETENKNDKYIDEL